MANLRPEQLDVTTGTIDNDTVSTKGYVDDQAGASDVFKRTGTTIEPQNAGDDLDIGTGDITASRLTIDTGMPLITSGSGQDLYIGASSGDLNLTPDLRLHIGNTPTFDNTRISIVGSGSITDGPNIAYINSPGSSYPSRQDVNLGTDDISIYLGAYTSTGVNQLSADAGSNFKIEKKNDLFTIGYDSGIAQGAAVTWNTGISLNTSGVVSLQQIVSNGQSFFDAYKSSTSTNVTGDGTNYLIIYDTEIQDIGSDYNNSTGIYTAPHDGRYLFMVAAGLQQLAAAHTRVFLRLTTSNNNFFGYEFGGNAMNTSSNTVNFSFAKYVWMDAADTAQIDLHVAGSTKTVDVQGAGNADYTHFMGGLVC